MRQHFEEVEIERVATIDDDELDTDTTDEIEVQRAQIEQTRAEMSDTIEAIKEKLSPEVLTQQAKEAVHDAATGAVQHAKEAVGGAMNQAKEAVGDAVHTAKEAVGDAMHTAKEAVGGAVESTRETVAPVVETIRLNPVPAAMVAVGLGWLAMSARKQSSGQYHFQPRQYRYESFPRPAEDVVSYEERSYSYDAGIRPGTTDTTRTAEVRALPEGRSTVGRLAGEAQDRAQELAGDVRDRVSRVGERAQFQAQRAADRFQQTLWENPLAVGAVAAALGMAIGLLVPETRQENRMMGEARDRLVEKAQETAQDVVEKVQTVASEVVDTARETAREEARRQGLTADGESGATATAYAGTDTSRPAGTTG